MWIRSDTIDTSRGFFNTRDPGRYDCLNLRYDSAAWGGGADDTVTAFVSTSTGDGVVEGQAHAQTTSWQHVALTWASGQTPKLYVDGVLQAPSFTTGDQGGTVRNATKVIVGRGERDTASSWLGLIDDVRIYERPLSAAEVAELANLDPVAVDDGYEAECGGQLVVEAAAGVLANDGDADAGPAALTASLIDDVSQGQLALHADGSFEYTPNPDALGTDRFTYQPYDGLEYGNVATVAITLLAPPPPAVTVTPLLTNDTTPQLTGTVDDPAATIAVTVARTQYAAVNNGDGTWTLPDNAIGPPLASGVHDVLAAATNADNSTGYDETADELTIDTTAPTGPTSAEAADAFHVLVAFGEPVGQATAERTANYTITDPQGRTVAVASAARQADTSCVLISLSQALTDGTTYRLAVEGVEDLAGNAVGPGAEATFLYRRVDEGLLAWWTFDEDGGTLAADATGNGRDLQVFGAVWTPAGRIGGAYAFDGSIGNYLLDEDGEDYLNGLSAFTVAMWIQADATGTDRGVFTTRDPGRYDCINLRFDASAWAGGASNALTAFVSTTAGDGTIEGEPDSQGTDWQHVALSWASGGELVLYVDGRAQSPSFTTGPLGGTIRNATKLILGKGEADVASSWQGLIDEVRIYARQLAPAEVSALAASPTVLALHRNDGAHRPSELTAVAVQFSHDVSASLDAADLAARNDTTGRAVDLSAAVFTYDAQTYTGRWDLAAVAVEPGYHTLTLSAGGITNLHRMPLDGDGNGDGGDNYQATILVAVRGDADCNGIVDWADYVAARDAFGSAGAGWGGGDCDYDGVVGVTDYLALKRNFGTDLTPPPAPPGPLATTAGRMTLGFDGPVINEFMADNDNTLTDEDGDDPDWIEVHNLAAAAVDLTGWKLIDSNSKWVFPGMSLGAGGYRVIFASDKDRRDPAGELHTNDRLSAGGRYLGLPDGTGRVVHEYNEYPEQLEDISYGLGAGSLIDGIGHGEREFAPGRRALRRATRRLRRDVPPLNGLIELRTPRHSHRRRGGL